MPKAVHEPRKQRDRFYWYVNDVMGEAYPGYAIPGPHQGPSTYEMLKIYDPDLTLMRWFKHVGDYIDTAQIQKDWESYLRSPDPEKTLEGVTNLQHVLDNILKENSSVTADVMGRWGEGISKAIRLVLPKQKPRTRKEYTEWITYDAAALILDVQKDYLRKLIRREKIVKHPEGRKLIDRDSVFDYRDGR